MEAPADEDEEEAVGALLLKREERRRVLAQDPVVGSDSFVLFDPILALLPKSNPVLLRPKTLSYEFRRLVSKLVDGTLLLQKSIRRDFFTVSEVESYCFLCLPFCLASSALTLKSTLASLGSINKNKQNETHEMHINTKNAADCTIR